jgi:uncharacterized repeat protein (TIGR03803 family)
MASPSSSTLTFALGIALAALGLAAMVSPSTVGSSSPSAKTYTELVLHSFTLPPDGANPTAGLVLDGLGNVYGVTFRGGVGRGGSVFKVDATGQETILYSFSKEGLEGRFPRAGLALDPAGNLFGTTSAGGASGLGAVFKVDSSGRESVIHSFTGSPADGASPYAGLILDSAGNLYGTTTSGGAFNFGTVFELNAAGQETVLYSFRGYPDGANPFGGLARDASGNLYGTTFYGGSYERCGGFGCGTVFKLDTTGTEKILHSFSSFDGNWPYAGLVLDASGFLYGTAQEGGSYSAGSVFKLDTTGKFSQLFNFTGGSDGGRPFAGLVLDVAGNLYGTTSRGGTTDSGVVFELSTSRKETVLHSFTGLTDGAYPFAGVSADPAGNLYGTTEGGDPWRAGVVFKLTP